MKSLPDLPDEDPYNEKGKKKIGPIEYTKFGEENQEDDLEEVLLEEPPSPRRQSR